MREHMGLFRGKHPNGMWVYGSLAVFRNFKNQPYTAIIPVEDGENQIRKLTRVDPDTVGECTGLEDKDGKLIFEGDILKGMRGLHRVYYDTSLACFEWAKINGNWEESFSGFADEYEIIGNIYDNPELMEGAGEKK